MVVSGMFVAPVVRSDAGMLVIVSMSLSVIGRGHNLTICPCLASLIAAHGMLYLIGQIKHRSKALRT
jgi:hypothetical protein